MQIVLQSRRLEKAVRVDDVVERGVPMGAMLSACFSVKGPVNFSVMGRNSFFEGSARNSTQLSAGCQQSCVEAELHEPLHITFNRNELR